MKLGFLFGAGAEIGYGFPSGGKFALSIFRHDSTSSKLKFKEMRDKVDISTVYAGKWLPEKFRDKNISTFGKSVYYNIIKDTIVHNRARIIGCINSFDKIARIEIQNLIQEFSINDILFSILGREVSEINLSQQLSFTEEFNQGNQLFNSSYFSALLLIYKNKTLINPKDRIELGKILFSIMQLHIGALGEELTGKINNGVFSKKDDEIDLFDDLGDIIHLNYSSSGIAGIEYLMEQHDFDTNENGGKILKFAQNILEYIYSTVLDYKSLIDSNWHYLYNPKSDWAKFCKICIFLLNVRDYILDFTNKAKDNVNTGYYHTLKKAIINKEINISTIATTNYSYFIKSILNSDLNTDLDVIFLNGSTESWYDPYLNRIDTHDELLKNRHIIVPLMFTQSGTKPMTSIDMSKNYVNTYDKWKSSDAIVSIGFGFGADDEHINGIIRTLVDRDHKKLIIIVYDKNGIKNEYELIDDYAARIKISSRKNISIIRVDDSGTVIGSRLSWSDFLVKNFS